MVALPPLGALRSVLWALVSNSRIRIDSVNDRALVSRSAVRIDDRIDLLPRGRAHSKPLVSKGRGGGHGWVHDYHWPGGISMIAPTSATMRYRHPGRCAAVPYCSGNWLWLHCSVCEYFKTAVTDA